jgi:uncharacterized protein
MTLSLHDASVPVFRQMLAALSDILDKAAAQASERGIDPSTLIEARLAPDMFPLARQVQIATDHAKGATARLAGHDVPSYADDETTLDELKARIAKTLTFIESMPPAAMQGAETRDIVLKIGGRELRFDGRTYLLHFALPNFFFHVTTAYNILRANGIEIGKRDFMGRA